MESKQSFLVTLESYVKSHGIVGVESLQRALDDRLFREQYIAEALLWIGDIEDHEETRQL